MTAMTDNRRINTGLVFLSGLAIGVVCYLLAEWLTPQQINSSGHHDILLANRLGFIYTPVVGLWLGWLQRSWPRALLGAAVGILIGFIYMWLCSGGNFLAIMIGFPCLLGGVLAVAAGSNRSPWLSDSGIRLGKGLLAGLVLGFVYMFILNVVGAIVRDDADAYSDHKTAYVRMMWRAGPVALGLASALFFILMRWAVDLTRVKILVFEENEVPKGNESNHSERDKQ
jgi:hypothetical protein